MLCGIISWLGYVKFHPPDSLPSKFYIKNVYKHMVKTIVNCQ